MRGHIVRNIQLDELFEKCTNYTNTDIKKYNKVIVELNKNNVFQLPEKKLIELDIPEIEIKSKIIQLLNEVKKPRGFKVNEFNGTSILDLKAKSEFLPESLPHIEFNHNDLIYKNAPINSSIPNDTYRFKECVNRSSFLSSSRDLIIYHYNWNLDLLGEFNASSLSESHVDLRCVDLSSDQSQIIFTIVDKAYILNSEMNIIAIWQVPVKDGFEKRKKENSLEISDQTKNYLSLLELNKKPTKEEIKTAFRKQVLKWHPDKNPNNPLAEEKTIQLIQAYEYLSGESAKSVFDDIEQDEFYWVDWNRTYLFKGTGISLEISFLIGSGEDWIYGVGFSKDSSQIYLGCYSGKIYQVNQYGIAEKIYIIPEDKESKYISTNPISSVIEYKSRKYIVSHWYLYILNNDMLINYIKNESGNYRWFDKGFLLQNKKEVTFFDLDGNNKGSISFKSPIKHISFYKEVLLIETTTKSYSFKYIITN